MYGAIIPFNLGSEYCKKICKCLKEMGGDAEVPEGIRSSSQLVESIIKYAAEKKEILVITPRSDRNIVDFLYEKDMIPRVDKINLDRKSDYLSSANAIHEDRMYEGLARIVKKDCVMCNQ